VAFADAFRQAAERGAAEVVCIDLASGLSSTFQSASVAAADAPLPVHVVDSGSASLGQAMVVLAAARAAASGATGSVVVEQAASEARRVRVLAVIDRRDHLQRSGRLGSSGSIAGSVLAVKPIVEVRGGEVVPVGRQRTLPRALDALAALVAGTRPEEVAVVHGDADARSVEHLVAALAATGPAPSVHLLGPVVGAHLGPGAVGVAVRAAPADR
jgi:fatty acid kinase fatty acid binding subunit